MKFRFITTLIVFSLCIAMLSCKDTPVFKNFDVDTSIGESKDKTKEASTKLDKNNKDIKQNAESIILETKQAEKDTPDDLKNKLSRHYEEIINKAKNILVNSKNLDEVKTQLDQVINKLVDSELKLKSLHDDYEKAIKSYENAVKERDEAVAKANDATRKAVKILILLCIVGIGVCGALGVFVNPMVGIGGAIICGITLTTAIMVDKYFDYIAYAGLALASIGIIYLVYQAWVHKKALTEVVHTTEIAKARLPDQEKKAIFGQNAEPGQAYVIQSGSTEKLVNKIRQSMKPMWEHTIQH